MDLTRFVYCLFVLGLVKGAAAPPPPCDCSSVKQLKQSEQSCLLSQLVHIISHLVSCNQKPTVTPEGYKKLLEVTNCSHKHETPEEPTTCAPVTIEVPTTTSCPDETEPTTIDNSSSEESPESTEVPEPTEPEEPSKSTESEESSESSESSESTDSSSSSESVEAPTPGLPFLPVTVYPTNLDLSSSSEESDSSSSSSEEDSTIALKPTTIEKVEEITIPEPTVPPQPSPPKVVSPVTVRPEELDDSSSGSSSSENSSSESSSSEESIPDEPSFEDPSEEITAAPATWAPIVKECAPIKPVSERSEELPFQAETFFIPVLKFQGAPAMSARELKEYIFNLPISPRHKKNHKVRR